MTPERVTPLRPSFADHVTQVPVGDELVLHEAGSGRLHLLDRTAALVVSLFDGARTVEDIADAVAAVFDERPERIRDDVNRLVRDLAQRGVVGS